MRTDRTARHRHHQRSDAELVAAARAGDRESFGLLYHRHSEGVLSFALQVTRSPHDASDAAQTAFTIAAERLHQLRDPARFRPWVFTIAKNCAYRQARSRAHLELRADPGEEREPEHAESDPMLVERDLVVRACEALEPRDRGIIAHRLRDGSNAELVELLGVTHGHAHVLTHRALRRLRAAISVVLLLDDPSHCIGLQRTLAAVARQEVSRRHRRVRGHVARCTACAEVAGHRTGELSTEPAAEQA
ncbi:MAG: RNA polymerase sigma factor [Acidimicrobiia bacterium]